MDQQKLETQVTPGFQMETSRSFPALSQWDRVNIKNIMVPSLLEHEIFGTFMLKLFLLIIQNANFTGHPGF